jgi:hypothetical protein
MDYWNIMFNQLTLGDGRQYRSLDALLLIIAITIYPGNVVDAAAEEFNNSAENTEPAVASNFSPHEEYIGLFKGNSRVDDSQVTATYLPCFPCAGTTESQSIQGNKGNIAGIRWGAWWDNFGFAMDYSVSHADNTDHINVPQMSVEYQSLSFIPMVRAPLFRSESMPGGRINLYGGLGICLIPSANIDVTIPPNPPISGRAKGTGGTMVLVGASMRYSRTIFFVEWRETRVTLASDNWAPADSANVPISRNDAVIGVAYRY